MTGSYFGPFVGSGGTASFPANARAVTTSRFGTVGGRAPGERNRFDGQTGAAVTLSGSSQVIGNSFGLGEGGEDADAPNAIDLDIRQAAGQTMRVARNVFTRAVAFSADGDLARVVVEDNRFGVRPACAATARLGDDCAMATAASGLLVTAEADASGARVDGNRFAHPGAAFRASLALDSAAPLLQVGARRNLFGARTRGIDLTPLGTYAPNDDDAMPTARANRGQNHPEISSAYGAPSGGTVARRSRRGPGRTPSRPTRAIGAIPPIAMPKSSSAALRSSSPRRHLEPPTSNSR